jgi:hypothetical protein
MLKRSLLLIILMISMPGFAQVEDASTPKEKELTRQEKRKIKRSLKNLQEKIVGDPVLAQEYLELISTCKEDDKNCQERLRALVDESVSGTQLSTATGMTYGICRPDSENKKTHRIVYSHRNYDCKLSSHGKVYQKDFSRKIYGPGLFWDHQSLVMFCTGPAYGEKMIGYSVSVGAYFGLTAGTVFGRIGACIIVGAGKSAGALIGADVFRFQE